MKLLTEHELREFAKSLVADKTQEQVAGDLGIRQSQVSAGLNPNPKYGAKGIAFQRKLIEHYTGKKVNVRYEVEE